MNLVEALVMPSVERSCREQAEEGADYEERGAGDRSGDDDAVAGTKEEVMSGRLGRWRRLQRTTRPRRSASRGRPSSIQALAGERIERLFGVGNEMGGDLAGYAIGMPRAA